MNIIIEMLFGIFYTDKISFVPENLFFFC